MHIEKQNFGFTREGEEVFLYTLANGALTARIATYGGVVTELWAPDRNGEMANVVLGLETLKEYEESSSFLGCIVGRFANRIRGGRFKIDGKEHILSANEKSNHLHGGRRGFDRVVWEAESKVTSEAVSLSLRYLSRDGEEGYPGNLDTRVTYTLDREHRVTVKYNAATDSPTIVNLTHHSYFNLAGAGTGDILSHELMINAAGYTVVDEELIPTGEIRPVDGSALDFRSSRAIGARIAEVPPGYDHNYALSRNGSGLEFAARAVEPRSGRTLEIRTTEPGLQLYTGNYLNGTLRGK